VAAVERCRRCPRRTARLAHRVAGEAAASGDRECGRGPDQPLSSATRSVKCGVAMSIWRMPACRSSVQAVGWSDLSRRHGFVGPERDHETVTHVDLRLARGRDVATGFGRESPR
jgi:hypothetical protein